MAGARLMSQCDNLSKIRRTSRNFNFKRWRYCRF